MQLILPDSETAYIDRFLRPPDVFDRKTFISNWWEAQHNKLRRFVQNKAPIN